MVTSIAKRPRPKGYYRKRRTQTGIPLYPSIYDSTVLYFNNTTILQTTAGAVWNTNSGYIYTTLPFQSANFVNLYQYFAHYRVEKMHTTFVFGADTTYPLTDLTVATIHDNRNYGAITASMLDGLKSQRVYSINTAQKFEVKWVMDKELQDDYDFQQMPTVVVNPAINFNGGIVFRITPAALAPPAAVYYLVTVNTKFKIRFKGRCASAV